jgi:LPXTG-motif cell wall-anchored protein
MFRELFSRVFKSRNSTFFGLATGGAGFELLVTGLETGDKTNIIFGALGALASIAAVLFKEKGEPKM